MNSYKLDITCTGISLQELHTRVNGYLNIEDVTRENSWNVTGGNRLFLYVVMEEIYFKDFYDFLKTLTNEVYLLTKYNINWKNYVLTIATKDVQKTIFTPLKELDLYYADENNCITNIRWSIGDDYSFSVFGKTNSLNDLNIFIDSLNDMLKGTGYFVDDTSIEG